VRRRGRYYSSAVIQKPSLLQHSSGPSDDYRLADSPTEALLAAMDCFHQQPVPSEQKLQTPLVNRFCKQPASVPENAHASLVQI
jgi:hypothetical protein